MELLHKNIATYGHLNDELFWLVTIIIAIWGGLAMLLTIFFSLASWRKEGKKADGTLKGEGFAQTKWILIPVILVTLCDAVIDVKTAKLWAEVKGPVTTAKDFGDPSAKDALHIRVTARQFTWSFDYDLDGNQKFTDDADMNSQGILHVPVGRNIVWHLTSEDVLHSFWIKNLRMKQDALPGRYIRGWFKIGENQVKGADFSAPVNLKEALTSPEDEKAQVAEVAKHLDKRVFEIACAEICGSSEKAPEYKDRINKAGDNPKARREASRKLLNSGHHNMSGYMVIDSKEGFDTWVKSKKQG